MALMHLIALLLQNLRCVMHRQFGELKGIVCDERFSVRYCRGDGRSRTIYGSFCSCDSSPALKMAMLICLSTSLIRTSDNETKNSRLSYSVPFYYTSQVNSVENADNRCVLSSQQNHDRLMNSVSMSSCGW